MLSRSLWTAVLVLALVPTVQADPSDESESRSVGRTNAGRLENGVELQESAALRFKPGSRARYGTAELVAGIQRAAERVAARHPGSVLTVGDLSAEAGGPIPPHRSHRSGRDADIGFYLLDEDGRSVVVPSFVHIQADGTGSYRGQQYRLDVTRTWMLLSLMVNDPATRVQYVFVSAPIRQRLLAEGRRLGATAEEIARVDRVSDHRHGAGHTTHMHFRIYCPRDDHEVCEDQPPYHDWY